MAGTPTAGRGWGCVNKGWVEVFIIIIVFSFSWENEIVEKKAGWKFLLLLLFFLYLGRTNTKGLAKFWEKMRDGPNGGRRREETEHQLCRFRFRGLEKKKRVFFCFFLLVFFII